MISQSMRSFIISVLSVWGYKLVKRAEAEDLCSDIILAVISAIYKQETIENFYAFVWSIARRVYAGYSEKRNKNRHAISIENVMLFCQRHTAK